MTGEPAPGRVMRALDALSDRALWLAIAGTLFVLSAWPLLLVDLPPLQDLPNHVACAYIIEHLDRYPELMFNGYWKSNSAFTLWLHAFPDHLLPLGARLFTALTIAVTALAIPWFVRAAAGRRAMLVASLLVWPLVHGFFLSMGMLNFSLAAPLSLVVLVMLDRQRTAPSLGRGLAIVALSVVVWFAHPFPLVVVGAVTALEVVVRRDRAAGLGAFVRTAVTTLGPLVPIGALVLGTAAAHMTKASGAPIAAGKGVAFLTPWELIAHFWLDAQGALTRWGSMTAIPAVALPVVAWRQRTAARPMIGPWGLLAIVIGFLGLPLMLSNWWYLNSRMAPFVWFALAIRVPPRLPRALVGALVAAALSSSVVLGIDYARLDRDRAELAAGVDAVPVGATLLPLLFSHRKTSDFTASLTHAWADYVLARQTSAPLVFAVERSYPITYRTFPPSALIPPALDRFAELNGTPAQLCDSDGAALGYDLAECTAAWRQRWGQFWQKAEPRFSHVLAWAMPAEARGLLPTSYHRVFAAGDLEIYARGPIAAP